jgi:hypothetical protein
MDLVTKLGRHIEILREKDEAHCTSILGPQIA